MEKKKINTHTIVMGILIVAVIAGILAVFTIVKRQHSTMNIDSFPQFEVTSNNLKAGKWDTVITNTTQGKNESPQLQWRAVEKATNYTVIMVDPDGNNWLHWTAITDKTSLEQGEYIGEKAGYVGPYPPSGTHHYIVYVFALKETPLSLTEKIDSAGADMETIAKELNSGGTSENNILAVGKIEGTYSKAEESN
jgi:phosphatidylethanolamine-binding protein (PEBP) family uncharacterized protein